MSDFDGYIAGFLPRALRCRRIEILQVNLGRICNLECAHCHLGCSPARTEMMTRATMERVIEVTRALDRPLVDITGGAPEMHPEYRTLVSRLRDLGLEVQTRTNLVALLLPENEELAQFLREQRVALVASLPCYLKENVSAQRGCGVFEQSVAALQHLNSLGYGGGEDDLPVDLVHNPVGAALPGEQSHLEEAYRQELGKRYAIRFRHLHVITNMPIGRFLRQLESRGGDGPYRQVLKGAFNPDTLDNLMCRRQICVDWDGRLYDCDFNLALGMSTDHGAPSTVETFDRKALES